MKNKKMIIAAILGLAVFGTAIFALIKAQSPSADEGAVQVSVGKVAKMPLEASIFTSGRVLSAEERNVFAEVQAGKIESINVKEGASVKAGDPVLVLSATDLNDQIKAAQIQLSIAKETLAQTRSSGTTNFDLAVSSAEKAVADAQKAYDDKLNLYNSGAVSLAEKDAAFTALDRAKTELVSAQRNFNNYGKESQIRIQKLNVEAAQNTVNQLLRNKEKLTVKAPISGVVYKINVKTGDQISLTLPLMSISATNQLQVESNVSEYDIDLVNIGQKVIIKGDGFDDVYSGTVTYISSVAESVINGQSTETVVKIKMAINEKNTKFKPNFSANVEIQTAAIDNALTIPYESIYTTKEGEKLVFVVKDGMLSERKVKTGVEGDLVVEVIGSVLEDQEVIVLNPTEDLKDGAKVIVQEAEGDGK